MTSELESSQPVEDELDASPLLEQVFGDSLPKMRAFHAKLEQEGQVRGLIGPRDMFILWERHLLNSAAVVPFIKEAVENRRFKTVADVGSGGGFPGIVAAIMLPDVSFTLIEPMERRVAWLQECVDDLELSNVTVLRARSDEVIAALQEARNGGPSHGKRHNRGGKANVPVSPEVRKVARHPYAAVTCRAVAPMTKLAGWTLPLLEPHGELIALKGRSAPAEIEKAAQQIAKAGGAHARVLEAQVAPGLEPTHVVIVDKK